MTRYLDILNWTAARIAATLPREVDPEDVRQAGVFGLADAIEKFVPERNIRFTTYAPKRIRGQILDWLRSIDWMPRLARQRGETRYMVSLSQKTGEGEDGRVRTLIDRIEDPVPLAESRDAAELEAFGRHLRALPRHHRLVCVLYYREELTMKEVGRAMGLSESRVSQLHSEAIRILRSTTQDPEAA